MRYFRHQNVIGMIPVFDYFEPVPIVALKLARWPQARKTRVVFTIHSPTQFLNDLSTSKRWVVEGLFRMTIRMADEIVAVSRGVATDWADYFGIPNERIRVIYNPVDVERIQELAAQATADTMQLENTVPLILAVGRLSPEKDFATLLWAFAILRERRPARLLILGEGEERATLTQLAADLGITEWVSLPGFVPNPHPYMARASVLALSSRYEGFSNVILEALALGIPIVATDCPYGPSEILEGGRYGALVPVGNPEAMAEALLRGLVVPIDPQHYKLAPGSSAQVLQPVGIST